MYYTLNKVMVNRFQKVRKSLNMNKTHLDIRSHLFTVQVRKDELGDGQGEWRGKVQHVHSGETFYFHEWTTLVAEIMNILEETESDVQENSRSLDKEG